ncbi:MAG: hypothetical protein LBT09_12975 [Planctomycetaceae bacterium]|nr:hypothetical protein [Planctomycetaceae bacterium]
MATIKFQEKSFAGGRSIRRTVTPVDSCSNNNPVDLKFKRKGSPTGK